MLYISGIFMILNFSTADIPLCEPFMVSLGGQMVFVWESLQADGSPSDPFHSEMYDSPALAESTSPFEDMSAN